ncbi:MAG: riboflavin biosynthesis protein RibF [Eubacteriales bacterium]|nr:riboflavin biosynthesis protein RibF [Eubacteriales bacterium]
MKILEDFNLQEEKDSAITIGNFDGLHLGHKKLIKATKKIALEKGLNSIVFSFNPHPLQVLRKNEEFLYILSQKEKKRELLKEDIDIFLNYPFDSYFAQISPEGFIDILCDKLKCKALIVGEDYCFGANRVGNVNTLISIGKQKGIDVIKIPNIIVDGERVSSSAIRKCLLNKKIKKANLLLNRPYSIIGTVVEGNKLGRTIGFPTANILPQKDKFLLPDAVYITKTKYEDKIYDSITNIGKNPTINNSERIIETYIFNFKKDIYGKEIEILFYDSIRDVKKFSGINELKEQISKDIAVAIKFFNNN